MCKQEFLAGLRMGLSGLPREDIEETLTFYSEMIDDRMEEGLTEEEAVQAIGTVEEVLSQIIGSIPLSKLVKEKVKPKRAFRAWEIVLLVLGFPVYFPLIAAGIAVLFSLYGAAWSVILSLWAIMAAFGGCFLSGLVSAAVFVCKGSMLSAVAMVGVGLFCAGLTIFLFFGCKAVTKGMIRLTEKTALSIKSAFIGKEK